MVRSKYHGPTNHRGSRISVELADGMGNSHRRYYSWEYALNPTANHLRAIQQYLEDRNMRGRWVYAHNHTGYTAVRLLDDNLLYIDGHWPDGQPALPIPR